MVTFTEDILNGNLHFLCNVISTVFTKNWKIEYNVTRPMQVTNLLKNVGKSKIFHRELSSIKGVKVIPSKTTDNLTNSSLFQVL